MVKRYRRIFCNARTLRFLDQHQGEDGDTLPLLKTVSAITCYDDGYFVVRPDATAEDMERLGPAANAEFRRFIPDGTVVVSRFTPQGETISRYVLPRFSPAPSVAS